MRRANWNDLNKNGQIGDWAFFQGDDEVTRYIAFRYPRPEVEELPEGYIGADRGHLGHVPITTEPEQTGAWLWDGNEEAPTISPSINIIGSWHGFIREGKLTTA